MTGEFKIEAHNPTFEGVRNGVEFKAGVGFTDNVWVRKQFEEAGCKTFHAETGEPIFPAPAEVKPESVFGSAPISTGGVSTAAKVSE